MKKLKEENFSNRVKRQQQKQMEDEKRQRDYEEAEREK